MSGLSESPVSRKRRLQRERVEYHQQRRFEEGRLDLEAWIRYACTVVQGFGCVKRIEIAAYLYLSLLHVVRVIRAYNRIFACSSLGANIDESFQDQGVSNFKIHGQIYHRIGSLLPDEGQNPVFA
ncbi:hypothetical protein GLOIN_2v1464680 [Rhizophagus clarus]|uniref:Uncharacterized protein n=1 Tax=Rhizophagus clarus TaxID=94130 RepID=A0A8H3R966_9GLOM|nr:hypothetical protein GLOIN_2v1464680 [Rhizophagus clarus]